MKVILVIVLTALAVPCEADMLGTASKYKSMRRTCPMIFLWLRRVKFYHRWLDPTGDAAPKEPHSEGPEGRWSQVEASISGSEPRYNQQ